MSRKSRFLLTVVVVVMGLITIAGTCFPPADCSPGFWKNRGHTIYGAYDDSDLYAKGHGSGAIRHARAAELNAAHPDAGLYCD